MSQSGPPPGLDLSETRQATIIGIVTMVLSIAATAVALRVYTRGFLLKQFGLDDGLACFAFVSGLDATSLRDLASAAT
jgi:hypothetical protein